MWCSQRRRLQQLPALRLLILQAAVLVLFSLTSPASASVSASGEKGAIHFLLPDESSVLDTLQTNHDIEKRPFRLVLVGPTGSGKTTFCEFLRFFFRSSHFPSPSNTSAEALRNFKHLFRGESYVSDTNNVTKYTETLSGGGKIEIVDTPGLLDTGGPARDFEHMIEIEKHLETLNYVDAILFVFNGKIFRANDEMKYLLAHFSTLFRSNVYSNIALVFSFTKKDDASDDSIISNYFSKSEFGFSSEEVKSRSFFLDNPLPLMATRLNRLKEEKTFASFLGDKGMYSRFRRGAAEVSRLLQYFTANPGVERCVNPNFSSMLTMKKISEYLAHIPALQQSFVSARETQTSSVLKQGDAMSKHAAVVSEAHASLQKALSDLEVNLQSLAIDYPEYLRVMEEHLSNVRKRNEKTCAHLERVRSLRKTFAALPTPSFSFDSNGCSIFFLRLEKEFRKRTEWEFRHDGNEVASDAIEDVCKCLACADDTDKCKSLLNNVIRSIADDTRRSKWGESVLTMSGVEYYLLNCYSASAVEKQQSLVKNRCWMYERALRCLRVDPHGELEDKMLKFIYNRHGTLRSANLMKKRRPSEEMFVKLRRWLRGNLLSRYRH